jgi:hypothetical protein
MTGGVPEDDIALRVLQVFVQAPPLLLSTANHSFTNDVHREHVPQAFKPPLGWISSATRCKLQCCFRRRSGAMRRLLLVTSVLCAIDTTQAFAQHEVSQQLLELEEADRNIFFTMLLHGSNKRCDQVIRTLFNAAYLDVDEWEALCRDHNSYSLNVPADPDATITSLHCRELSTTSKMLLQSVGSRNKASGCRIKGERRKRH